MLSAEITDVCLFQITVPFVFPCVLFFFLTSIFVSPQIGMVDLLVKFKVSVIFEITSITSALILSPAAFSRTCFASPEDSEFKCIQLVLEIHIHGYKIIYLVNKYYVLL